MTTITPDIENLRHALRLIHCIQKERGCSCAYYANNANINASFEVAMKQARIASDFASHQLQSTLPIQPSLNKIRSLIDNCTPKNPQDCCTSSTGASTASYTSCVVDDLTFHRIFVCFNTLISTVVHECVLKDLSGEQQKQESGKTNAAMMLSPPTSPIRNSKKQNNIVMKQQQQQQQQQRHTKPKHTRHLSSDINQYLSATDYTEGLNTPERQNHFRQTFAFSSDDTEGDDTANEKDDTNNKNSKNNKKNEVQQLSDLLRLFVQLKESAGVERAILSSLLAFRNNSVIQDDNKSNSSLPSFRMLTNDLILEVENQRALCHKLHQLPSGPHHTLVLELAELSPRLKELQQIILTNFSSLQGAEYDYETIWDIITMYIDKLHSIELLIIEDLDLACAEEGIKTNHYKPRTAKKAMLKKSSLSTMTSSSSFLLKTTKIIQ